MLAALTFAPSREGVGKDSASLHLPMTGCHCDACLFGGLVDCGFCVRMVAWRMANPGFYALGISCVVWGYVSGYAGM